MTMSPNIETCHEELALQENQLVKVYGDQDEDGFYLGQVDDRVGYIPCNMVAEVHDQTSIQSDLAQTDPSKTNAKTTIKKKKKQGDNASLRLMIALYDYDVCLSPNIDSEVGVCLRLYHDISQFRGKKRNFTRKRLELYFYFR
jgi:RIMS-binding protein 2